MVDSNASTIDVSVVIPAYGRAERLRVLVDQVLDQDLEGARAELIIVDDGSPEPVELSIKQAISTTPFAVNLLRRENGGPAAARNYGAAAARGELLLFIDDDLSIPRDLIRQHLTVQRECGPALVNCALDWRIEAEPEPFARWYRQRTADWGQSRIENGRPVAEGVLEITAPLASTANLSIPRMDFEGLGGFDEGYPYGCEDQDLAGRADRAGLRILLTTRTTALHVETHNTLRKLCERQRSGARDTVRFLKRFAVEHHVGKPEIARTNDPVNWSRDGAGLGGKKSLRRLTGAPIVNSLAFASVAIMERLASNSSLLRRAYDLLVGTAVQKGWREGLALYGDVEPLEAWDPRRSAPAAPAAPASTTAK